MNAPHCHDKRALMNRPTGAKQRSIGRLCRPMNPRTQLIPPCKGGAKAGALSMSECCAALTGRIHFIVRFIWSRALLSRLTKCYVAPPLWGGDRARQHSRAGLVLCVWIPPFAGMTESWALLLCCYEIRLCSRDC